MELTANHLIGYSESSQGQARFNAFNPATGHQLWPAFAEATDQEIAQAANLAHQAFETYRRFSDRDRAYFLMAVSAQIQALDQRLIDIVALETGLPLARILSERARTLNQIALFADFIADSTWQKKIVDAPIPDRTPVPKPAIIQKQIAMGPVAVFGASNFPLAFSVAGSDTISALAAGCPVVCKAHPAHPATSELVGRAILKAAQQTGMPEGVFSLLHGRFPQVGSGLVTHPAITAVGFTGSLHAGKAIYDLAVRRAVPIPVYAEMGSVNPVFMLPSAFQQDTSVLAAAMAGSITLGTGQFCTNPGLIVVPDGQQEFINTLASSLTQQPLGNMLTAQIRQQYIDGIESQRSVKQIEPLTAWDPTDPKAHLLCATAAVATANPILCQEVFGPSSVVVTTTSQAQMLAFASQLEGHLTASIWGSETELKENIELVEILSTKVGRLIFNGFPTGVEVCHAMVHGGPFPATTDARSTSVGTQAIYRFTRPVAYQDFPDTLL